MAMILLLDSLSRCLNGTSNRGGGGVGGVGASGPTHPPHFPSSDEPAEVQVRLRDRYSRSSKGHHDQARRRRRSTTPKNRNGRRPEEKYEEEENHLLLEELISATTTAQQDDVDALADARRDAHAQARSSSPQDQDQGNESSTSRGPGRLRRRRRQRSAPKLTIEERRNGIFRLPSDHPASRPPSPAGSAGEGSGSPSQSQIRGRGRSRSSPRVHMVTPEPHPVGLMCGRASPSVVFRRGGGSGSGSGLALSHLLESRALCFASPVRDAQELAEEEAERAAKAAASSAAGAGAGAVDNSILLNDQVEDDPTVNTADYTYATQDDTVASTHYFEAKLAHLVETSPPMPLYRQYEVTEADPDGAIRQIVETRSHRSAGLGPVQDLAGGLINVVRKKWAAAPPAPAQAQAPQAPQARSPRGMQEPTSPAGQQTATSSSSDPPTPPRYPEQRARRQRSPPGAKSNKLGGRHRSDDSNSSVPSLDFSRNSSQST